MAFGESETETNALNLPALILFAAALVVLRRKKRNPILVMVLCGVVYLMFHVLVGVI